MVYCRFVDQVASNDYGTNPPNVYIECTLSTESSSVDGRETLLAVEYRLLVSRCLFDPAICDGLNTNRLISTLVGKF